MVTIHWLYWSSEKPLVDWFKGNYQTIGFQKAVSEDEPGYYPLRSALGFKYRPDFVVERNGKWFRLEVERLSSNYQTHPEGHSDIILCYHDDSGYRGPEVISLEKLGRLGEITEYWSFERILEDKAKKAAKKFAEETRAL